MAVVVVVVAKRALRSVVTVNVDYSRFMALKGHVKGYRYTHVQGLHHPGEP